MKRLPVGKADFASIRERDYYYVDKTMYLEKLEQIGDYLLFLRPRRFGKSLFSNMMQCYYDINASERFEKLFGGLYVGAHPTPFRNSYLILSYDFSNVSLHQDLIEVQFSFKNHCTSRVRQFLHDYEKLLPPGTASLALVADTPGAQLECLAAAAHNAGRRIYVFIDEYDNFINTILSREQLGSDSYAKLTHEDGFYRSFFTLLKGCTNENNAGVDRIYITGVTPIALNDVTSGFAIATNISRDSWFNEMAGFTTDDVLRMLEYYRQAAGYTDSPDEHLHVMKAWYDNFCFSENAIGNCVFNTDMVLNYVNAYARHGLSPNNLIDTNVLNDFSKMRHLVQLDRDLKQGAANLDDSVLFRLCQVGEVMADIQDVFFLSDLSDPVLFESFLFYLGLLSFDRVEDDRPILRIPNLTVRKQIFGFVNQTMKEIAGFSVDMARLGRLVYDMAYHGRWEPVMRFMAERIREQYSIRDLASREQGLQLLHCVYFGIPQVYDVSHERELAMGYNDLALFPDFHSSANARFSYLLEFKYINAGKEFDSREQELQRKCLDEAAAALRQYRGDSHIPALIGHTTLICIAVVYRGARLLALQIVT